MIRSRRTAGSSLAYSLVHIRYPDKQAPSSKKCRSMGVYVVLLRDRSENGRLPHKPPAKPFLSRPSQNPGKFQPRRRRTDRREFFLMLESHSNSSRSEFTIISGGRKSSSPTILLRFSIVAQVRKSRFFSHLISVFAESLLRPWVVVA